MKTKTKEEKLIERKEKEFSQKLECQKRLKNNLIKKSKLKIQSTKKSLPQHSENQQKKWDKDKLIYKQIWDNSSTKTCEECGIYLGNRFEDDNGRTLDTFRYSHYLTKAAYPLLRWEELNFNLLCKEHHSKWEFSTWEIKKTMKIYNKEKLEYLLKLNKQLKNK